MIADIQANASGTAYGSMVNAILGQLASGDLQVGDQLPTERELRETYEISINSVRRGIGLFVDEGVLTRRRGSGVYVAQAPSMPYLPTVARDTIMLHYDTWFRHYHPYYSELRRGIRDSLPTLGWKTDVLVPDGDDPYQADREIVYDSHELAILTAKLTSSQHLAGAIIPASHAVEFTASRPVSIPVVVVGKQPHLPYVAYDWDAELLAAVRAVLRRGGRRLLVMGSPAGDSESVVQQAAFLEGCLGELGSVHVIPANTESVYYSRFAARAYEQTKAYLTDHPETDGIIIGNDFEAQGAFDAVAELRQSGPVRHLAALVSKESRLLTGLSYDSVVADGYAVGQAIVEHLHAHIRSPETAPRALHMQGTLVLH